MAGPSRPPLSYGFASFHPGDYDRYPEPLGRLWALGFRWVTLVPTFVVREPFQIGLDYTPALATIGAALEHALALGFNVKLEPHIDWQSTLDGRGPWRGGMSFDPTGDYFERIIAPLLGLAVRARGIYPEPRILFTLGSELDTSLRQHPEAWMEVRRRASTPAVHFGHKLNHDAAAPLFRSEYLAALDYVSFSFYPGIRLVRPASWWRSVQPPEELELLAAAFDSQTAALNRKLPLIPEFHIGEFGLGGGDVERPYKLDPEFFENMDQPRRALRRNYYAGFLLCASRLPTTGLITFWSAGCFDFLGIFNTRYQDDSLISLVEDYNRTPVTPA